MGSDDDRLGRTAVRLAPGPLSTVLRIAMHTTYPCCYVPSESGLLDRALLRISSVVLASRRRMANGRFGKAAPVCGLATTPLLNRLDVSGSTAAISAPKDLIFNDCVELATPLADRGWFR